MKEVRGKEHVSYRGAKIKMIYNFSETMQARREWSEIFKVLREKENHQPRILQTAKLSFKSEGEVGRWNLLPVDQLCKKC